MLASNSTRHKTRRGAWVTCCGGWLQENVYEQHTEESNSMHKKVLAFREQWPLRKLSARGAWHVQPCADLCFRANIQQHLCMSFKRHGCWGGLLIPLAMPIFLLWGCCPPRKALQHGGEISCNHCKGENLWSWGRQRHWDDTYDQEGDTSSCMGFSLSSEQLNSISRVIPRRDSASPCHQWWWIRSRGWYLVDVQLLRWVIRMIQTTSRVTPCRFHRIYYSFKFSVKFCEMDKWAYEITARRSVREWLVYNNIDLHEEVYMLVWKWFQWYYGCSLPFDQFWP